MESINIKAYFDPRELLKYGNEVIYLIQKRTGKGMDKEGNPFRPYSTRDFPIPLRAIPKHVVDTLAEAQGQLDYFYGNKHKIWIWIRGGYATLKKAWFKKTSYDNTVNLQATGEMMGSMTVTKVDESGNIQVGFTDSEMAARMYYNILKGRDPMGLTDDEWNDPVLKKFLQKAIKFRF